MCGRFVMATPVAEIGRMFGVQERPNLQARYNVAPTQAVAVVRAGDEGGRRLDLMRWGLVPFWAKDAGIGSKMINARSDGLAEKPAFREAVRRRRALIPADGFYEWRTIGCGDRTEKRPLYFRRRDGLPLAFAGLWESWKGPKGGEALPEPMLTASIVTTDANATLREIHDRMPVVLPESDWDEWLSPDTGLERALSLLRPAADDLLEALPVSTRVNSVRNEGPELILPDAPPPPPAQGMLL
ncbi:MAG TPA: SOS response-associated peptidase [Azospirillaceae bacterium]|nr:SOS response-associated peptidase [Azospirillaceae bacterium]